MTNRKMLLDMTPMDLWDCYICFIPCGECMMRQNADGGDCEMYISGNVDASKCRQRFEEWLEEEA